MRTSHSLAKKVVSSALEQLSGRAHWRNPDLVGPYPDLLPVSWSKRLGLNGCNARWFGRRKYGNSTGYLSRAANHPIITMFAMLNATPAANAVT